MYHTIRTLIVGQSKHKLLLSHILNMRSCSKLLTPSTQNLAAGKDLNVNSEKKCLNNNDKDDDTHFGMGSKLSELDSKAKKQDNDESAEQFGTLTNKLNDM